MRPMTGDEVNPELRHFLVRHAPRHVDQILLEAVFLEHTLEALVANEDRVVTVSFQLLGDADAVQRRAEGRFREQYDGLSHAHPSLFGPSYHGPIRSPQGVTRNCG